MSSQSGHQAASSLLPLFEPLWASFQLLTSLEHRLINFANPSLPCHCKVPHPCFRAMLGGLRLGRAGLGQAWCGALPCGALALLGATQSFQKSFVKEDGLGDMTVSMKLGCVFWVSLKQEPYYLGSVLGSLIFGNSHIGIEIMV